MTVKTSISLTKEQAETAKRLVEQGSFASVSSVMQRGLELVREETDRAMLETELLKAFLEERRKGPFISAEESQKRTKEMLEQQRAKYGL